MAKLTFNRFAAISVVSLVAAGAFFSACSDDSNPSPGEPEGGTGETTGAGGKTSNGGKTSTGGSATTDSGAGGTAGEGGDASTGTGGTGGESEGGVTPPTPDAGDAGVCVQDPDKTCGTCPATTTKEFLDHCTDSSCTPFDNTKLAKLVNGKLPDLP